ncbi:bleomycin resistance protein [Curvibacter sp. RS43]|uniref:Bleomycin resistance protein n=1 Tax=Curvibacter microcysteis TaxID=3026419 RepID=A0ABT5MH86_9BURK|nr:MULTISPECIES: VOC family protein [unclassified Curvibacter]MDD0810538.1 bleomycin resistance protein [Curvibacter sp. RS43]MDD0815725.1 bleomycin resistance protein [Curvibacter sp. HBC28]
MRLWFNLLCPDPQALMLFYQALLGLPEATASRSPIYRALACEAFELGFNALPAYGLLGLQGREPLPGTLPPVTAYATFMLTTPAEVSEAAGRVGALGGQVLKPPYATYYGQWQAVLADPQGHAFRLSTEHLPEGVEKPAFPRPQDTTQA